MKCKRDSDGRKLDHHTLQVLRQQAVKAVREGQSVANVAVTLGMSVTTIFRWLAKFADGGQNALLAKPIPGRPPMAIRFTKPNSSINTSPALMASSGCSICLPTHRNSIRTSRCETSGQQTLRAKPGRHEATRPRRLTSYSEATSSGALVLPSAGMPIRHFINLFSGKLVFVKSSNDCSQWLHWATKKRILLYNDSRPLPSFASEISIRIEISS